MFPTAAKIRPNISLSTDYYLPMPLLEALAAAFINTFGITQPTEKTRRRVAWFILTLLVLVLLGLLAVGFLLLRIL
jgi:hypothetical protein